MCPQKKKGLELCNRVDMAQNEITQFGWDRLHRSA
jgi:hypothetical protein